MVYNHTIFYGLLNTHKVTKMTRQSITLTEPNDEWLKQQVLSKEYTSKSDIMNALIRNARLREREKEHELELELIKAKLTMAEKGGFIQQNKHDILAEFKSDLKSEIS